MHWELPIRPVVAEAPLRLPINVLLALPEYVTSNPNVPLFNLPGAVSSLLGDWQRAVNVMNPKVWAPGWDSENFLNFVFHAQPRPSSFPESAVEGLRASGLPGLLGTVEDEPQKISKYAVVHFVGKFHFDTASEDHFLDLGEGHLVGAGILRDALVSCRTRLLILQSLEVNNFPGMASQRLAEYIVGGGGPAVLIVDGSDTEILNAFFFKLYANILQNRPLESAVRDGYDAALRIWLVYGKGGNDLLRFDAWMEELTKQLDDYSGLVSKRLEAMRRLTRSLHRDQIRARSRVLDDSI